MDCRTHFKLDIAVAPWDFQIFFITGEVFSYYSGFLSSDRLMIHDTPPFSQTALHLEKLLQLAAPNSIQADLLISSYINSILTDCIMGAITQNGQSVHIAPYLSDAKKILDSSFADVHSLDNLAAKLHISKYRLCREFGDTYGMPPLKYLNHRRIEIARHLLQTTNLKVHEIGSRVGIDNTNHFINLFRRENGMTPSEYKQRMTF